LTVRNPGPAFWESGLVALRCTVAKTIDGDSAVGKASFEKQYSLKSLAGGVDELFGVDETARLNVKVKTPEAPGIWQLEWQMYDEEKAAVFGRKLASTIEVTYNVGSGASEAKISPEKSSLTLKPGQKAAVGLDVENTGDTSWPENTHVVIRAISDPGGRTARGTTFDAEVKVGALNPGEGRSLSGSTAPEIEGATWRGDWKLEALVEADGKEVRGAATFEVTIEGSYDGKFGSPRVPKSLKPKEKDDWQFTVTNKGDLRWDEDTVCLKSVLRRTISGKDKDGEKAFEKTWTDETNGEAVDEGDSHKFTVGIVAPPTPGQWTIRWYLYDVQKKKDFGSYVETTIEVK